MTDPSKNPLIEIIVSQRDAIRDRSLTAAVADASLDELLRHCDELDAFRRRCENLYHRVRALFFLAALHRYHLPPKLPLVKVDDTAAAAIPFTGYEHLLGRRYLEAIDDFLRRWRRAPSDPLASALAEAYHGLAFQTLADQVRRSVRTVRGNQWMFRLGHPAEHPLRIDPSLFARDRVAGLRPLLRETTAVRMDFSHSAWSDIFFLGMDFPEGARVINASVDLAVRGRDQRPTPPIETYFRLIDDPVIRLTSVDLDASADVSTISEMFDFGRDYLGLLKAAVIAAGIVPPGLEGSRQTLAELLGGLLDVEGPAASARDRPRGIEIVSKVNDIPKGSRLAVSTNLLGSLIAIMMRASGQIGSLTGMLTETDRRLVAARAILGEWIGGSGGGWQDSGGVWPGLKLISGANAGPDDPEYGISRGRLMPLHKLLGEDQVSTATRAKIQESLVLVHGGMAQNVGPILEMVTEHYLLRGDAQWAGRAEAIRILDQILDSLRRGDVRQLGQLTTKNFEGPLQAIIPWATNRFTDSLIEQCRGAYGDQFWGFWMLGGMAGGGMGFLFDPAIKPEAQDWLARTTVQTKRDLESSLPFAMDPVVYDFSINDRGSFCERLEGTAAMLPQRYHALMLPAMLRIPIRDLPEDRRRELEVIGARTRTDDSPDATSMLLRSVLPRADRKGGAGDDVGLDELLDSIGFDRAMHESIRDDLRAGRIGLAQNRLSPSTPITDVQAGDVVDVRAFSGHVIEVDKQFVERGAEAIRDGRVAVITLAAGVGSRWTEGAGVCKALHPFYRFEGRHRSFLEVHLAKTRRTARKHDAVIPHVFTTSHLTDAAIRDHLDRHGFGDEVHVSTGRSIGLRMVPTQRDLRFQWEEMRQQVLDAQSQKMRESVRGALLGWARQCGEASDYTDNLPGQCIHPVGHWYEVPNLIRNGVLRSLLDRQPALQTLMLHNIDTLGADIDAGLLGQHLDGGAALTFEVISRRLDDRGGGLARVGGRPRLVEGLAMPDEQTEFSLTFYNTMTTWIDIDGLLTAFGLSRDELDDPDRIDAAIRSMAARLPTYITLKDVKKRWGHAQEDIYPVSQFEKLWGDMTALPQIDSRFLVVPQRRGSQLKSQAQLDRWKRDGTADFIESLCEFC